MMKWSALLLVLLLLPLSACGGKPKDSDFYTFKRPQGDGANSIYVGEIANDLENASVINLANEGVSYKVNDHNNPQTPSTSIRCQGKFWRTMIGGLKLDDPLDNVIPAYQDIAGVTVVSRKPTQIILQKTIDSARYTATFNGYNDGTIKNVTPTNQDTCAGEIYRDRVQSSGS